MAGQAQGSIVGAMTGTPTQVAISRAVPQPMPAVQPAPTITQPTGPNVFGQASGALGSAISAAQGGAGFQPVNVTAGQLAGMNFAPYTNPYESQVVGQSLADLNRAREMAMGNVAAQATAARAFGGTRQALMEAETNRAFAEQAARTASGLRQAGFSQALQAGQFDVGTAMQAALANQQAALSANQQRLGAAGTLGNLSNLAFGMGRDIQSQQMQQGAMQQALQQQLIDAARGQYGGFTSAPTQSLSLPLAALGAAPVPETTTKTHSPGLFDYITAFAQMPPRFLGL